MALIEKLKAIGDAIRDRTGTTDEMTLDEMVETIGSMNVGGGGDDNTYILVDENGYEVPAVLVDEPVMLTANATTDIRKGMTAVTDEGVVTGEKEIPSYRAEEGIIFVDPKSTLEITTFSDMCEYTVLQAIVCGYNTTIDDSVAAEKVVIGDHVYCVNSIVALATIEVDLEAQTIKLGVSNDTDKIVIIRYMIIKEDA